MTQNGEYYSLNDLKNNITSFLFYLMKKWWLLMLVILAGMALSTIYYRIQKPKYKAVTTFILEDKSASSGGLAGLASQFGVNISSLTGGGNIFAGDNILNILKSKKVVEQVLLSGLDSVIDHRTLADEYLEFTGLKKAWQKKPDLKNINFKEAKKQMTPIADSVLNIIYESIIKNNLVTEKTSKQGSIIMVQVTAPHNNFARLMAERLVAEAGNLYMDIRTGTAKENIAQLQRRSDSLLILLNSKSYSAAASQPLDINPGIKTAIVPVEIATRDKTVLATLYAEVTKNLEASKLLLSQQTPVIQLLDQPSYLLDDHKKSWLFLAFVGAFGAGAIYVSFVFLLFMFFGFGRKENIETLKQKDTLIIKKADASLMD
jgi:hypothetical protein